MATFAIGFCSLSEVESDGYLALKIRRARGTSEAVGASDRRSARVAPDLGGGVGGRLLPWTTLGLLCLRISHVSTPSGAFEGRLPVIANLPSAAGSSDCSVASRASESAAQAAARVRLAIEEI